MLIQLTVVVVASVGLVHTRHVYTIDEKVQHAHTDAKTFEHPEHVIAPKINQSVKPIDSSDYREVSRSQDFQNNSVQSSEPQDQFTVKDIKPRRVDGQSSFYNNNNETVTHRNKKKLKDTNNQQVDLKNANTRKLNKDINVYNHNDNSFTSTSETSIISKTESYQMDNKINQQNVREIFRTPLKFDSSNQEFDQDSIVFTQDKTDYKPNYDREKNMDNGVITLPTAKTPFTNAPLTSQANDNFTSTTSYDFEDRFAIDGDKCPANQIKIVGSNRCVKVHPA